MYNLLCFKLFLGNYVNNEITTTRKRIRPNLTNHKTTDGETGLIENKYKDQETEQTGYQEDTTTNRVFNFVRNNVGRVPEETYIQTESSFTSNEISTGRPENSVEESTIGNLEIEENSVRSVENIQQVSIVIFIFNENLIKLFICNFYKRLIKI